MAQSNRVHPLRTRYSSDKRRAILAAFRESGLTQPAFAARERISVHTLRTWIYKPQVTSNPVRPPGLVQIPHGHQHSVGVLLQANTFEAILRGGHRLRISSGFDPSEVRSLLSILEELC